MRIESVRFLSAAETEVREAVEFYDECSDFLGDEFVQELGIAVEMIQMYPEIGRLYLRGTRRFVMRRFPYGIVYRIVGREIRVVAVAHQRRRPGYWVGRIR